LVSAGIALTVQQLKLDFYVNNVTKEFYQTGITGSNQFYGAPREFGVRLGAKF
jgi:iron complex outermembrane recepter protein